MSAPQTLPAAVTHQVIAGFTQAAARYDEGGTEFFQEMGARLVDQANVRPGAHVLYVGCGKGAVTVPAARLAGEGGRVHAIDLAAPMLQAAAARARACGLGTITVTRGDAKDPPFAAGTFGVVLAGYVIQLLPRPAHAVRRWRALLKPGGTLGFFLGAGARSPVGAGDGRPGRPRPARHVPVRGVLPPPPFDGTSHVDQMLTEAGYQGVGTVTCAIDTVYDSAGQWWQACQSQAPWAIAWRHIPPGRLETARRDAFTALDGLAGPGGTLTRTLTFACTTGQKSASSAPLRGTP